MKIRLLCFLLVVSVNLIAQDDEDGKKSFCGDINKKAMSLYEKGTDKKKYQKPERLEFLQKALAIEPDFPEALLAVGLELVVRFDLENKPITPACAFFVKAIQLCPRVSSEPYYYIGRDYYERQINDSALKYLQKFLDFKDEDETKFAKNYKNQLYNAQMMLKTVKAESALRKNVPFDPRVVNGVSTERDEYLAYISPDDRYCYFVRRVPMDNKNQVYASDKEKEMFMYAVRDKAGKFDKGQPMEAPFNTTDDNQGGCSISIDNKHLYFAMMRNEGGLQPNVDLYVSDFANEEWGPIRKLSANVNDPKYWDSQPTISSDGLTLYFASDRPGGFGGIDLYFTKKDPVSGQWSKPMNCGPMINTAGDEKTPFIHSDSETLYFSSGPNKRTGGGLMGFGGADIFFTRKDEKGEWMEPVNIGSPINSESDDTGFFVSADANTGYFFSFDEGKVAGKGVGRYDLFSFHLYEAARPSEIKLIKGSIKDDQGNAVAGAVVEVKDPTTKKTSFATVDSSNGEFMVAVKAKKQVLLTVKKDGVAFNNMKVKADSSSDLQVKVKETKEGATFALDNIYYTTNSAELTDASLPVLESFAKWLKENPSVKVEIQGHTDNVGNPKDNEALSSNRAFSVKSFLEEMGIAGERIEAKGYGSSRPLADNATEAGRARNRRTEFMVLSQ